MPRCEPTKLVRLKLQPKLIAHMQSLDLRRHLAIEFSRISIDLPPGNKEKVLNDLAFLLSNPLFLYTISPRVRLANRQLCNMKSGEPDMSASQAIESRHLSIGVAQDHSYCLTQLRYGESVLIDARELMCTRCSDDDQQKINAKSLQWFCDEVEFLGYEYKAREEAAEEILGREPLRKKSKIVKLKVGKNKLGVLKARNCGEVRKERKVKLKVWLWKDAIEG